jgi:hypothetical protein
MVDFWETLGQIIANDDFRKSLEVLPNTPYTVDKSDASRGYRLQIGQDTYNQAQALIRPVIADGAVSLMTSGEILICFSSVAFRNQLDVLRAAVKAVKVVVTGRSTLFTKGLGVMMIDDAVRGNFANKLFTDAGFDGLTQPEKDDLTALGSEKNVQDAAISMCSINWGGGCCDKALAYSGYEQYVASPYPQPLNAPK